MNQALYAHMNNKRKMKKKRKINGIINGYSFLEGILAPFIKLTYYLFHTELLLISYTKNDCTCTQRLTCENVCNSIIYPIRKTWVKIHGKIIFHLYYGILYMHLFLKQGEHFFFYTVSLSVA
jgi:hypothetical protein